MQTEMHFIAHAAYTVATLNNYACSLPQLANIYKLAYFSRIPFASHVNP